MHTCEVHAALIRTLMHTRRRRGAGHAGFHTTRKKILVLRYQHAAVMRERFAPNDPPLSFRHAPCV